nr:pentapeptide repeat-containing protein [Ramlibacter sp.]
MTQEHSTAHAGQAPAVRKQQILSRWTRAVLFECEIPAHVESGLAMRHALKKAVSSGAVLSGAVLSCADLSGAVLRSANLRDAVLSGAVLSDADLRGAVLRGA